MCTFFSFVASGDFEAGKNHLCYVLKMKLNAWGKLPLRLCGLGLPQTQPEAIQEVARDCLQQYAANPDAELRHRVSNFFCAPGSPLYDSMVSVANGAPLQQHVELHRAAQILKLIPVAEHVIEGPHASTQRQILRAPRCGPVAVSMALRGPEIERFVMEGPMWAGMVLAENVDLVSSLPKALPLLGLQAHPAIAAAEAAGKLTTGFVCSIIYRCDAESQFMNLRGARKAVEMSKDKQQKQRAENDQKRDKKATERKLAPDERANWFFQCLLFHCLRTQEDTEASVFSLPASVSSQPFGHGEAQQLCDKEGRVQPPDMNPAFQSLDSVIAVGAGTAGAARPKAPEALLQIEDDLGDVSADPDGFSALPSCGHAGASEDSALQCFCRVVHANPSRQKIQHVSPALGQKLKDSDIAVTRHKCLHVDESSAKIEAAPLSTARSSSADAQSATTFLLNTSVPMGSRQELAEQLLRWEFDAECEHALAGVCPRLLDVFLDLGAFEGRAAKYVPEEDDEDADTLGRLLREGVLRAEQVREDVRGFQLTQQGMCQLKLVFKLRSPRPVCLVPDIERGQWDASSLGDLHPCQLWLLMETKGWQPCVATAKEQADEPAYALDTDARKVFFLPVRGTSPPSLWYMLALALSDLVWRQRLAPPVLPVEHSWQVKQYRGLVESDGTTVPARQIRKQALVLQDDDGRAGAACSSAQAAARRREAQTWPQAEEACCR